MNPANKVLFIIGILFTLSVGLLAVKVVQNDDRNRRMRKLRRKRRLRRHSHHVEVRQKPLLAAHQI